MEPPLGIIHIVSLDIPAVLEAESHARRQCSAKAKHGAVLKFGKKRRGLLFKVGRFGFKKHERAVLFNFEGADQFILPVECLEPIALNGIAAA